MYSYSLLLLLAAILAVVSSTTLRGSQAQDDQSRSPQESNSQKSINISSSPTRRRRLVEDMTCKLFLRDTLYKATPEQPNGHSQHNWVCELSPQDAKDLGMYYVQIVNEHNSATFENAVSGVSTLSISPAIIDMDVIKMYLPHDSTIQVRTERDRKRRYLAKTTGTLKTLMVRVVANGHAPTSSVSQLRNDVFLDESCLKSQYEACSYKQLKIQPDKRTKGVTNLDVDFDTSKNTNQDMLNNAVFAAFDDKFGGLYDNPRFDLVMFCMPPGASNSANSNWGAFGDVNSKVSVYSNDWCGYVASQMHEVGHNLDLDHSREVNEEGQYGDVTGVMGSSPPEDNYKMCFNPAKNWQLGWYNDQSKTTYPLNKNDPVQRFVLNGVADYQKNSEALVVLRLEQTSVTPDYYIGYNRKVGINADVTEDGDMVTILRKDTEPTEYGFSYKVAKLFPGESHVIEDFDNQRSVEVKFVAAIEGKRDAIVEIIDVKYSDTEPEPCEPHTVVLKTDNFPKDSSWELVETTGLGRHFGRNPEYNQKLKVYQTKVCLPYKKTYQFTIEDGWGDGICCVQGDGYYKLLDSKNKVVLSGGEDFKKTVKTFKVGTDPNPPKPTPTKSPTKSPVMSPNRSPIRNPTKSPVASPTKSPTRNPTKSPVESPTKSPTRNPTKSPVESPTKSPTRNPTKSPVASPGNNPAECKDKEGKFKVKKRGGREKSCKHYAKKKKCNKKSKGIYLWTLCPVSCNKCDDV